MKRPLTCFSIAIVLLFVIKIPPSLSEPTLTDTITLSHKNISTSASGKLLTKNFQVHLTNISENPLLDIKITLGYVAGYSVDGHETINIGNLSAGDTINTEQIISVIIDRSQLTDGLFVFTWLVEYDTLEGEHVVDEYLIAENE
jgi:hypothetical protein